MFRHKRSANDFAEEIKSHLDLEADELKREGLGEDEARWKARREFGNVRAAQEHFYQRGRMVWLDNLVRDFQFAARQMIRSPGFVITAVLILALGIAANVIVFGVLQTMILQPLNVPRPDRMITFAPHDGGYPIFSYPAIRDVRDGNTVFTAVAAEEMTVLGLEANGATRPVWANEVGGQYFEAVGIKPALGRLLQRSDDDHPEAAQVAVLTYATWKSYFGADPNIVGTSIRINKHPYTIVGVAGKGFNGTEKFLQPDLFIPLANQASIDGVSWLENRRETNVFPIARMKDGITLAQAQDELNNIAARVQKEHPKEEEGLQFKLARPGLVGDFLGRPARRFLAGVMMLAGILLLAACANLGGLFAARTADRTREIAIRMAIGSSRWRVVRQVLMEAFLVSILGGVCACILSWIALTGLAQWHPPTEYPIRFDVAPRPSLIVAAFAISVLSGILFGVMPLRQIFNTDPNEAIKSGASQSSAGRRWALRDILLAAQIALCCVTITAAFVSLRGLSRSLNVNRGFNANGAVLTKFDLSQANYSADAAGHFQRLVLDKTLQLPGVVAAGYASATPLSDTPTSPVYSQQTTDFRPNSKLFFTYNYNVSPGYLNAAQTPLLEGRDISFADDPKSPLVAVVNQQFARSAFHLEHGVLGRYFKDSSGHSFQIVGLVPDGKYFTLTEDPQEAAYFPILQHPAMTTTLIVRLPAGSPDSATGEMAVTVRKMVRDLDPAIPIRVSSSWTNALAFNLFPTEVATVALGLFGAFGLLLSITGTFGLASYTVSKRLRELSLRVALGAGPRQILSASLGRMLTLLASGSLAGLLLGIAVSRVLAAIVVQASAQDPFVLAAVALTIVLTGAVSVAGPVRRALRVDPARLLREQ